MSRCYAVAAWMLDLGPSGASTRLLALLRALPDLLSDDETLVVLHRGAPPAFQHARLHYASMAVPARPTLLRVAAERLRLRRRLVRLRADVLHLETLPVPPRLPCPVVLTIHDLRDLGPFARRPRAWFRHTLNTSVARCAALIAPSRHTAGELSVAVGRDDITVVPGVVTDEWLAAGARAAGEAAGTSRFRGAFLHVGHLEPRKDLDSLLAAYALARTHTPALPPLVLAGRDGGSLRRLRRSVGALQLASHVYFLGEVTPADLHALYRDAGAVLLPSRCEGFGMPALEALAYGKPVLVSDAGALPEVVAGAGRVLPAGDVSAWAAALTNQAGSTPDAAAAPRRRARAAEFSAKFAAATLLALWRQVCSAPSAAGAATTSVAARRR